MASAGPATLIFLLAVPAIILLPPRYVPMALSGSAIAALALTWEGLTSSVVPEPYLDEVFHIPQAQAYCNGDFDIWDPKLTTPPGLYLVSTLLLSPFGCTVGALRTLNAVTLALLLLPVFACRNLIYKAKDQNWEAAHTALNICLFPPLFFFSGLYYTDVLSTLLVVVTYSYFLGTKSSLGNGIGIYILGIAALGMRQTNIFWVAVFLAGLEWVRTSKAETTYVIRERLDEPSMIREWGDKLEQWTHGSLHDPKLGDAGVMDIVLCALSIAVAAVCSPLLLLARIWPYLALLVSFAGFVFWNGGVVLGDKSNHVATMHVPQMLYLWPFITFFSLPLVFPYALDTVASMLPTSISKHISSYESKVKLGRFLAYSATATLAALAIVHFNTIIHPFTLADNRHYMFYVFRYTILRHALLKYALTPFYILGGWLVVRSLGGASHSDQRTPNSTTHVRGSGAMATTAGANTSFVVIWLLSTGLSLVTAPLVEPRYLILPWVMWRLQVPPIESAAAVSGIDRASAPPQFPLAVSNGRQAARTASHNAPDAAEPQAQGEVVVVRHDARLYVETLWFALINALTGYVFLYRGFAWAQEPGAVQRFMW